MKKVLYITTVSSTINAFLVPHIKMLIENGYRIDCACSINKRLDQELMELGVNLYEIPFSRNPLNINNINAFKKLREIQENKAYDIVHVHTPIAAMYGRLLKVRFPKVKTIYTAHGYHFLKGGSKAGWILYYPIEKIMAKFTDVTININEEDFNITKEKLKPKQTYLVRGVGLDLNQYKQLNKDKVKSKREELGLHDKDFTIIMIAELNENKNQIQLIKAVELLKGKCLNIKVLFVGEGDKVNELKLESKNRGVESSIKFLGYRTDINELINISDIGILLSYREGLPRSIMELMANGKKVIATNIRGNRDLVCNENVGKLVKVDDFRATANAIEYYYNILKEYNQVSVTLDGNNKGYITKEIEPYDIRNVVRELKNIYEEI